MAKSQREKELERSRARREQERSAEGAARRRVVGVVLVMVLGAGALGTAVALRDTADATPSADDDVAAEAFDALGDGTGEEEAVPEAQTGPAPTVVPCEPATDAPEVEARTYDEPPAADLGGAEEVAVRLRTTCGDVRLVLAAAEAPRTVANFVGLAQDGYYEGVPFHRVIDGFMVQAGDPTGTGTGCADPSCSVQYPGYRFDDELDLAEEVVEAEGGYPRGTLAMANAGPDSNGSQFFIVQADPGYPLPPSYAVFGRVAEGMDVVDRIAQGPTEGPGSDAAADPVRILAVEVLG